MDAAQLLRQATQEYHAGRLQEAARICRQAVDLDPNSAAGWHLLGLLAHQSGDQARAVDLLWRSLTLQPQQATYWNNLAGIHRDAGDLDQAAECLREALRLRPDYAAAYNNLGEILKAGGQLRDALACYRAALQHLPSLPSARSNFLLSLLYDPKVTAGALRSEHQRWGNLPGVSPLPGSFANKPDPERRLRVGYVSPDFRQHAVARFFAPILDNHDREQFSVFLYAEIRGPLDTVSQRFRRGADGWYSTAGHSAQEVAKQIRADGIDILVDLAGHTGRNRLDVFACRAAPVQMTYLGYPHITGLPAIDYRVTDAILDPPGTPDGPTERLLRLPGTFCCFEPPAAAPAVAPPPLIEQGHVTFGSHHPLIKLNEAVLALWARILQAVPSSRLLLFRDQFTPRITGSFQKRLRDAGLMPERVEIRCPRSDESSYLAVFHDIDILLDCFPFTGHTMTCEALWMGVPVLTLQGDRAAGRLSASVLTALKLTELIAQSPDAYVSRACELAAQPVTLAGWRADLRERVQQHLCPGPLFTRGLEEAYQYAWRNWCRKTLHTSGRAGPRSPARPSSAGQTAAEPEVSAPLVSPSTKAPLPPEPKPAEVPAAEPPSAAQLVRRGERFLQTGAFGEAVTCLISAVALQPDCAMTHVQLANALRRLDRNQEALESYRAALRLDPKLFAAHIHLAHQLAEEGQVEPARAEYSQAYRLQPRPRLRLLLETLLPVIYESAEHLQQCRSALLERIRAMDADGLRVDPTQELLPAPRFLPYQGLNDREILSSIARLVSGPRRFKVHPGPRRGGKKVRIGFLTADLYHDSAGPLHHGLLRRLSRERFEVHVLSHPPLNKTMRRQVRRLTDPFVGIPPGIVPALRTIRDLGLDILYLPDAGMHALTWTVACNRLAPVQVATWGHPETTGLPTVDYFLSSTHLETHASAEHYSEKLIRLSRLGVFYDQPRRPPPGRDRASFGLPEKAHLYLCPQMLYKFHPDFDRVVRTILRQDPSAMLVLLEGHHPQWTQLLLGRLRRTMSDVYLRVRFLSRLTRQDFLSLVGLCDAVLDPVHFGGGHSTYGVLAMGMPIVTWPSNLMRGRLTYAMYAQMGFLDLVAHSADEYVQRAIRLGTDPDYRQAMRRRIEETRDCLYADMTVVAEAEEALLKMVESSGVKIDSLA